MPRNRYVEKDYSASPTPTLVEKGSVGIKRASLCQSIRTSFYLALPVALLCFWFIAFIVCFVDFLFFSLNAAEYLVYLHQLLFSSLHPSNFLHFTIENSKKTLPHQVELQTFIPFISCSHSFRTPIYLKQYLWVHLHRHYKRNGVGDWHHCAATHDCMFLIEAWTRVGAISILT